MVVQFKTLNNLMFYLLWTTGHFLSDLLNYKIMPSNYLEVAEADNCLLGNVPGSARCQGWVGWWKDESGQRRKGRLKPS